VVCDFLYFCLYSIINNCYSGAVFFVGDDDNPTPLQMINDEPLIDEDLLFESNSLTTEDDGSSLFASFSAESNLRKASSSDTLKVPSSFDSYITKSSVDDKTHSSKLEAAELSSEKKDTPLKSLSHLQRISEAVYEFGEVR
jgi:hypothetical protein